ncbi:MAG: cobalamin-binding protein [Anaerolineae bacterium]|nr:cobalamin-binding protein [Anaerolineae bacterium]
MSLQAEAFEEKLLALDRLSARQILEETLTEYSVLQAVEALIVPCLERIGSGWEQGRVALSQVYLGGRICEELVDEFLPPAAPQRIDQPPMAIAVLEDYHLLGKRIVYSCLRASGFELLDYGHASLEDLVLRTSKDRVRILLVSVLMLRSALRVKALREALEHLSPVPRLVVGGAPFRFDRNLWQEVGADAVGMNAAEAVEVVSRLIKEIA